jgi:hypothetical protein
MWRLCCAARGPAAQGRDGEKLPKIAEIAKESKLKDKHSALSRQQSAQSKKRKIGQKCGVDGT